MTLSTRSCTLCASMGLAVGVLSAQELTRALDTDSRWAAALVQYRDGRTEADAEALASTLAAYTSNPRLSARDRARVLTFLSVVRHDLKNDAAALQALRAAYRASLAPWPDSLFFAESTRAFVHSARLSLRLPGAATLRETPQGTAIEVTDESGTQLTAGLSLSESGGAQTALKQGSAVPSTLASGNYLLEVRSDEAMGGWSAPLVVPVRVTRGNADLAGLGKEPAAPVYEPEVSIALQRRGSMKPVGWLLGGGAMGAGIALGSKCEPQWDADKEVFLSYAASCGGWIGTAVSGLFVLIGAHSFLNPKRVVRHPNPEAVERNRVAAAAYEEQMRIREVRLRTLRQETRTRMVQIEGARRP